MAKSGRVSGGEGWGYWYCVPETPAPQNTLERPDTRETPEVRFHFRQMRDVALLMVPLGVVSPIVKTSSTVIADMRSPMPMPVHSVDQAERFRDASTHILPVFPR